MALTNKRKIELAKKEWEKANELEKSGRISPEQASKLKSAAHTSAEKARANTGYSGGDDGSEIIDLDPNDEFENGKRIKPIAPVKETVENKRVVDNRPSPTDIRNDILKATERKNINTLENTYSKVKNRLESDRIGIEESARDERLGINARDTMSRRESDVRMARGGLSSAGSAMQSDIAQTVTTQTGMNLNRRAEQQAYRELDTKLTEAYALKELGIQNAKIDTNIQAMENEMQSLIAKQEAEIEKAKVEEKRAFDLHRDNIKYLQDVELKEYDTQVKYDMAILESQIKQAQEENDFRREQVLLEQKAEISRQKASIDYVYDQRLLETKQSDRLELEKFKNENERGETIEPLSPEEVDKQVGFYSKNVNSMIEQIIDEIDKRGSDTYAMNESERLKIASPQILSYLKDLEENQGVDPRVIDIVLDGIGFELGR